MSIQRKLQRSLQELLESQPGRGEAGKSQAWLPAPMLGGEPLMDNASIRDFNGCIGCHIASVLKETLLLPKDMVELHGFKRSEVFLHTKRFLGIVCIYFFTVFFFFFTWHKTYPFLLFPFFFFFFKGCSKHFQIRGDVPLPFSTIGRREKTEGCCCANPNHCWK